MGSLKRRQAQIPNLSEISNSIKFYRRSKASVCCSSANLHLCLDPAVLPCCYAALVPSVCVPVSGLVGGPALARSRAAASFQTGASPRAGQGVTGHPGLRHRQTHRQAANYAQRSGVWIDYGVVFLRYFSMQLRLGKEVWQRVTDMMFIEDSF